MDLHNRDTAGAADIVNRSDQALAEHPMAVAGFHKAPVAAMDPVVGVAVGIDHQVAAEGRY